MGVLVSLAAVLGFEVDVGIVRVRLADVSVRVAVAVAKMLEGTGPLGVVVRHMEVLVSVRHGLVRVLMRGTL